MYAPWMGRRFGVEMEFNPRVRGTRNSLTHETVQEHLYRAMPSGMVSARGASYRHSDGTQWEVKTDSSCGIGGLAGVEVASAVLSMDADGHCRDLQTACETITGLSPSVNRACGLHVHVELTDFDWRELQTLIGMFARIEPWVFELLPAHRRNNSYCPPIYGSTWANAGQGQWANISRLITATSQDDFDRRGRNALRGSLNLAHWWHSGRVEFRLHSGTVNYRKIRFWTMLLLAMAQRVKEQGAPDVRAFDWSRRARGFDSFYVFQMLGLAKSAINREPTPLHRTLFDFLEQRRATFAPDSNRDVDFDGVFDARRSLQRGVSEPPITPAPEGSAVTSDPQQAGRAIRNGQTLTTEIATITMPDLSELTVHTGRRPQNLRAVIEPTPGTRRPEPTLTMRVAPAYGVSQTVPRRLYPGTPPTQTTAEATRPNHWSRSEWTALVAITGNAYRTRQIADEWHLMIDYPQLRTVVLNAAQAMTTSAQLTRFLASPTPGLIRAAESVGWHRWLFLRLAMMHSSIDGTVRWVQGMSHVNPTLASQMALVREMERMGYGQGGFVMGHANFGNAPVAHHPPVTSTGDE